MADPRLENLAKILVQYSLDVQKGDRVAIFDHFVAEALIHTLYRQILRAGGHPFVLAFHPEWQFTLFTEASDEQLQFVSPVTKLVYEEFECFISLESDVNARSLTNVDPTRQSLRHKAYTPIVETYMQRTMSGDLHWVIGMFPTDAYAQDAEMSLTEFEDFVFSTCYADSDDPVSAWQ